MSYGIYDLVNVSTRKISQLDAVTNNIANASTPGFKAEHLHFVMQDRKEASADGQSTSYVPSMMVDYSPGGMQKTGNVLDLAIRGEGFFTVETKEGVAYTKRGNFTLNKSYELVTQSGDYVLDAGGKHLVVNGDELQVSNEGLITVDGNEAGRLKMVAFDKGQALSSRGDGLYTDPGNAGLKTLDKPEVTSGYLELANVQAIKEMVAMIDIQHSFETYQKAIQTIADLDRLSTGRVGRLV